MAVNKKIVKKKPNNKIVKKLDVISVENNTIVKPKGIPNWLIIFVIIVSLGLTIYLIIS